MAKKSKAADADGAPAADDTTIKVSGHPRAARDIGLAKSWGGLAAFVIVLALSLRAGVPQSDAVLRAICGGFAGYMAGWGIAMTVWRHLIVAQVEAKRRNLMAELEALRDERQRQIAERQAEQAAS